MNILVVPDKFKGSLTADEVIAAIRAGVLSVMPNAKIDSITASDGGDGFLQSVRNVTPKASDDKQRLQTVLCETSDPLGRSIQTEYEWDQQYETAFIEMAKASGMELLTQGEQNPLETSTLGTGKLIRDAIDHGAAKIYVGLGGSATNDGGVGIAVALGYRFLDSAGQTVQPVGGELSKIHSIDISDVHPRLANVSVIAINDVSNPLTGDEGAAKVYAPQKGATPEMVRDLDAGLQHLAQVVQRELGVDAEMTPGSGAAGGTGYGLHVFLKADFQSGIEFVLSLAGIEERLATGKFDAIITGEGRIDDQTTYGKLVRGVAIAGGKHSIPVHAICGLLQMEKKSPADLGLASVRQIHDPQVPLQTTIEKAAELVQQAACQMVQDW